MLRPLAFLFGLSFLIIGILGITNHYMISGNLFGIFRINFEGHVVHIAGGILGMLTALYSASASKLYFLSMGCIATLFALFGFLQEEEMLFGMFANNQADTIAHAILGIVSLAIGFSEK